MNSADSKLKKYDLKKWIPYICVVLFYVMDLFIMKSLNSTHIDSDMSSMMVLTKQLNKEGTILSNNWFYATELRVINTQLLFKIALKIFPYNWSAARLFVQAIMLALYALLVILIGNKLELKELGTYIAAALLCPVGYMYLWYVLFANLYLTHILFCLLSTLILLCFIKGGTNKEKYIYFTVGILVAFLCSLNGIRYIMVYYAPVCVAAFLMLFFDIRECENTDIKTFVACNLKKQLSSLQIMFYSILTAISAFLGYGFTLKVLSKKYPFQTMSKTYWVKFSLNKILEIWSLFLEMFGYPVDARIDNTTSLFSLRGIAGGIGLIIIAGIVLSLVLLLLRFKQLSFVNRLMILIFISIFSVDSAVYSLMVSEAIIDNSSYWLHLFPYAFFIIGIEIATEKFSLNIGKELVTFILICAVLINGFGTYKWFYDEPLWANTDMSYVKNFLVDNGYSKGFASFWYSNVLTEASDGQLEMWTTWDDVGNRQIRPWAQLKEHSVVLPGSGDFVLFGPDDEKPDNLQEYMEEFSSVVYSDEFGYIVYRID